MSVTLNASTASGLIATSDTSGNIELQNNGTTRMTVSSAGVSFAAQPLIGGVAPPAFAAYPSAGSTSISQSTYTKATLDTEVYDTNSNFASSRFTPTVAGYYQINFISSTYSNNNNAYVHSGAIYKNGSNYSQSRVVTPSGDIQQCFNQISQLIYMNGSTDYLEFYVEVYSASGTVTYIGGSTSETLASGYLARGA
jgi:hypothetical protein